MTEKDFRLGEKDVNGETNGSSKQFKQTTTEENTCESSTRLFQNSAHSAQGIKHTVSVVCQLLTSFHQYLMKTPKKMREETNLRTVGITEFFMRRNRTVFTHSIRLQEKS